MSLMYDSKVDTVMSRHMIERLPVPEARGAFHHPVGFGEYIGQVHEALDIEGIEVANEEYAVRKDGQRFFGMMTIEPKEGELIKATDWQLTLGLRGSHDQRIPRGLALGSNVLVCSNLCFHGELGVFKTKQTTNIQHRLPTLIRTAIAQIPQMAARQEAEYEAYKNYVLAPRAGDAALVEIHRRGGLSAAQLGKAIKEWDKPSYDEHGELGHTAWRLFNACTEALKPGGDNANMNTVQERSQIATQFITQDVVKLAA